MNFACSRSMLRHLSTANSMIISFKRSRNFPSSWDTVRLSLFDLYQDRHGNFRLTFHPKLYIIDKLFVSLGQANFDNPFYFMFSVGVLLRDSKIRPLYRPCILAMESSKISTEKIVYTVLSRFGEGRSCFNKALAK